MDRPHCGNAGARVSLTSLHPRKGDPKTGGRPAQEPAGTIPRTGQVPRYFVTLTGPSCTSVSDPTGYGRSLVACVGLPQVPPRAVFCSALVPRWRVCVCGFCWCLLPGVGTDHSGVVLRGLCLPSLLCGYARPVEQVHISVKLPVPASFFVLRTQVCCGFTLAPCARGVKTCFTAIQLTMLFSTVRPHAGSVSPAL